MSRRCVWYRSGNAYVMNQRPMRGRYFEPKGQIKPGPPQESAIYWRCNSRGEYKVICPTCHRRFWVCRYHVVLATYTMDSHEPTHASMESSCPWCPHIGVLPPPDWPGYEYP